MSDQTPEGDLSEEIQALGKNLRGLLQAAWESEERRKLQREIEAGLESVGVVLKDASREFANSEAGQRLKAEADDVGERLRRGEVEARLRQDLLAALRTVNAELEKAAEKMAKTESAAAEAEAPSAEAPSGEDAAS